MGQYYLIKDVKRGNEWSNSFGNFQSYSLSLEGMGEPVSLNKAVPVKDEPEVGQKLYGTVELLQSQKGVTYYKFKTEKVPDGEYTAPQPQNQPQGSYEGHSDKEDSIARAVALRHATVFHAALKNDNPNALLNTADLFLGWLQNSGTQGSGEGSITSPQASQVSQNPGSAVGQKRQWDKVGQSNAEPLPEEPEDLLGWIQEGNEHDND